jgi:hypothetical protein
MATLNKYKTHSQMGSQLEVVEIEYDFAKDGGSTGAKDIIKFMEPCVLVDAYTKVDTACTSGGSATVIWGIKGGATDACLDVTSGAVAALTAGAVIPGETACKQIKLADNDILEMTIGTAALTAGKIRFVMLVQKF